MNLNLFMALFWVVLGLGLVAYHGLTNNNFLRPSWTRVSPGWVIVVLAIWNLVRWWSSRAAAKDRRFEEQVAFERQRRHYDAKMNEEEKNEDVVNPELDFRKPLPKAEEPVPGQGQGSEGTAPPA